MKPVCMCALSLSFVYYEHTSCNKRAFDETINFILLITNDSINIIYLSESYIIFIIITLQANHFQGVSHACANYYKPEHRTKHQNTQKYKKKKKKNYIKIKITSHIKRNPENLKN